VLFLHKQTKILMSESFLLGEDDSYGPDTDLVRDSIRRWVDNDNIEHQLNLKAYNIHTIPPLPDSIKNLLIGNEYLVLIQKLPDSLVNFTCSGCPNVRKIPPLPNTVRYVNFSRTGIYELPVLPINIKSIIATATRISKLPYLYTGLQELIISGTNVSKLNCLILPDTLYTLDISGTKITKLPDLNRGLKTLNISNTEISVLPPLPASLINLYVASCKSLLIQRDTQWPMHASGLETIQSYDDRWNSWRNREYSRIRIQNRNSCINFELTNKMFDKYINRPDMVFAEE
jgi:Leucine-rich repeat (LRR) protein